MEDLTMIKKERTILNELDLTFEVRKDGKFYTDMEIETFNQ